MKLNLSRQSFERWGILFLRHATNLNWRNKVFRRSVEINKTVRVGLMLIYGTLIWKYWHNFKEVLKRLMLPFTRNNFD